MFTMWTLISFGIIILAHTSTLSSARYLNEPDQLTIELTENHCRACAGGREVEANVFADVTLPPTNLTEMVEDLSRSTEYFRQISVEAINEYDELYYHGNGQLAVDLNIYDNAWTCAQCRQVNGHRSHHNFIVSIYEHLTVIATKLSLSGELDSHVDRVLPSLRILLCQLKNSIVRLEFALPHDVCNKTIRLQLERSVTEKRNLVYTTLVGTHRSIERIQQCITKLKEARFRHHGRALLWILRHQCSF